MNAYLNPVTFLASSVGARLLRGPLTHQFNPSATTGSGLVGITAPLHGTFHMQVIPALSRAYLQDLDWQHEIEPQHLPARTIIAIAD